MVMSLFYINNFDYSVTVSFLSMSEDLIPDFTVCLMSCLNLASYSSILIPSGAVVGADVMHMGRQGEIPGTCRNESETSQQGCQVC